MTQLSEHFTLEEAVFSETAIRKGVPNDPDADTIENMKEQAAGMEQVRELLGNPIHVSSWYRGPKLNAAIGGSKTSAHMEGYATDFTCPQFGNPQEVCRAIMNSNIQYRQLIYEGNWTHISFKLPHIMQNLTAHFEGGRVTYSNGIA